MSDRPTAVVVYLSGHLRGQTHRLRGDRLRIGTGRDVEIPVLPHELPPDAEETVDHGLLGELILRDQTYEIEISPGAEVWVNGQRVARRAALGSGDVIEIGEGGPVLRYRLYRPGSSSWKSMSEVFSDCRDCARHGGGGSLRRAGILLAGTPMELATQTAPAVRVGLAVALVILVGVTGSLWLRNLRLEDRLDEEARRMEGLAGLLEGTGQRSFTVEDFVAARGALETRLSDAMARVEALEAHLESRQRVISEAASSVVFLQGSYGFVETESGRPLRFVGPEGSGPGSLGITLDGTGPEVQVFYTGTGFIASEDGLILTNRHVAMPWEFDAAAAGVVGEGFTAVMRRFQGYLPGEVEPFEVTLVAASDTADVAVLRCGPESGSVPALPLTTDVPLPGEEVIVLGYPTGMQALLARTDPSFMEPLLAGGALDFWELARELARGGHIAPLATVGVVGQVTAGSVVYDAETTHGGSGGPVLNLDGKVVAVNAAVMPEFGGSNLGVPAAEAGKLLAVEPVREGDPT